MLRVFIKKTLKPFPQCRVDVVITGLKIVLADWQTLHMLKWAEYSSQLYGMCTDAFHFDT